MTFCGRFLLLITLFYASINSSFSQTACTPTTSVKNIELSYQRISVLPQVFRFYYKLTIPCNQNLPVINPLYIYDPLNGSSTYSWQIDSVRNITRIADPCLVFPKPPCYTVVFCHVDVNPPTGSFGFTASAEDCCLAPDYTNLFYLNNISLVDDLPLKGVKTSCTPNLDAPVYNSIINTIKIPAVTPTFINSSPKFADEDTILNVCTSGTLSYVVHASDPDGDSVAYHFSNPLNYIVKTVPGGPSTSNYEIDIKPPFSKLDYVSPAYSLDFPLGNGVSLDPVSGLVHGNINNPGSYLMTISAIEYRGGKVIDSVSKNFVVNVFDCSKLPKPVASIPSLINNCSSFSVNFPNNSTPLYSNTNINNTTFLWNFGDGDTSSMVDPVHIYADTGNYKVQLIIFPGLRCADTTYGKVLVYPAVSATFTYDDTCSGQEIHFKNTSVSTSGPINFSLWKFALDRNDTNTISGYDATFRFSEPGKTYPVILTVGNNKGCIASDTQMINIFQSPFPLAFHDTILSKGATLQLHANDGFGGSNATFSWTPSSGLSDPFIADPVLNSITDGTYYVSMKNTFGCTLQDSVKVSYYVGPDIYIPNAFTPNGDGLNDIFKPLQVGISKFYYFRVFNRWGQLMFETNQYYQGWNGKIKNNQDAPSGLYVWETAGVDYLGHAFSKKGTVLLLR